VSIKFYGGRDVWGNGLPENIPFEKEIVAILENGGTVLDVGCGKYKIHESCLGVDAYAENDFVNLKAFMWEMPFLDGTVDAIMAFHSLEHISKYQVLPTFHEFARVLKPGGKLLILVPDLKWALSAFLVNPTVDYEMDMIFGIQ
jgi:predicted SAM-dependent methyltransferase